MPLDAYQPCPCGSGKKIKFCECKDLLHDLDNVSRMIEGDQRQAALAELNRLLAAKPKRPALLAMKSTVQMQLDELESARETVKEFLEVAPNNPVALAQSAIMKAAENDAGTAVRLLQRALEEVEKEVAMPIYEAVGLVGQVLLAEGKYLAARGHFIQQAAWSGGKDEHAMSMVMQLNATREVPLPLKVDISYEDSPENAPWRGEFTAAMKCGARGAWDLACDQLESLAEKAVNQPPILKNLALMRGWLGDNQKTVAAWRRYAAIDALPFDDAVEAEAIAQLLDPNTHKNRVDQMQVLFKVDNTEMASEVLLSDRTVDRMPMDPSEFRDDDEPPPKGVYLLLDKELPATGEGITRETVPAILGSLALFGKQTDRDARLELTCTKADNYEEIKQRVVDLLGEFGGKVEKEEKVGDSSAVSTALSWNWRMPDDTPPETRAQLLDEYRQEIIMQRWPAAKLDVLDGKTPEDAAGDSKYAIRLAAAIELLQLNGEESGWLVDYDRLREKLQVGLPQRVDVGSNGLGKVSNLQLARVAVNKLNDVDLGSLFRRAVFMHAHAAIRLAGEEILTREAFDGGLSKEDVYMSLARSAANPDDMLQWIDRGREAAVASSKSPARWLVMELPLRLQRGEVEEFDRVMQTLRNNHFHEPGVAEQVYETLVRLGVIDPERQAAGSPAGQPEPAPVADGSAASPAAGGLWTPDSPPPSSDDDAGKPSKLWVPGMD